MSLQDFKATLADLTARIKRFDTALGNHDISLYNFCHQYLSRDKINPTDLFTVRDVAIALVSRAETELGVVRRRTAQLVKDLSLVSGLKPGKEFLNGFTGKWPKFKSTRVTGSRKFDACKKFGLLKQVMNKSRPAKFQGPAKFMGLAKATCIKNPAQDLLQLLEQNRTISRNRLSSRNENLGLPQLLAAVRTTRAQLEAIPPGRLTQVEQFYIHFLLSRVDIRTIQEFEQILTNHALNRLISWLDLAKEMCQSTNSR
ncbi:Protein-methionine sulfoxide oxidase Mical, partial [Folsomia candida]